MLTNARFSEKSLHFLKGFLRKGTLLSVLLLKFLVSHVLDCSLCGYAGSQSSHCSGRAKFGKADFGKLSFSQLQVEELAPGLARAWGRWTVEENSKKSSGWFTLILQKKGEHWRIIHDHSS
ncbi:nuclear transport factor 2 family protein [bacterium]|nr:nuclear transport factor 2 family protein [bacterium]